ncbi:hypothetical protein ES708_09007 [subsurface metagenome]
MKKMMIFAVVVVFMFSMLFIGTSCKPEAAPAEEAVEEEAAEEAVEEEAAPAEEEVAEETYTVGFSNASTANPWRVTFVSIIDYEVERLGNIELISTDAMEDPLKQMADCEDLLTKDIDALLISPAVSEALAPVVGLAHDEDIPIIVVDRAIGTPDFDAFVYTDCRVIGEEMMQYIADEFNGEADIVYLAGITGAGPEIERMEGMDRVLSKYPGLNIVAQQDAYWNEADGLTVMEDILQAQPKIDVVLCSDGNISIGALRAIKAAGREDEIKVAAMDAHRTDSLINLRDGVIMPFTVLNVIYVGGWAVKVVHDIIQGKTPTSPDRIVDCPAAFVDINNVDEYIDETLGLTDYSWKDIYDAEIAKYYDEQMQ